MERKKGELFSLLLLSLACRCFCQPFLNYTLPYTFFGRVADAVISSKSGEVFVALDYVHMIRLNSRLELLEEIRFDGIVSQLALSPNNEWLIGCGSFECFVYNTADLSRAAITGISTPISNDTDRELALIATDNSFYLGMGVVQRDDADDPVSMYMWLSQYNYTSSSPLREGYYNFTVRREFNRVFIGGFSKNNFVYFFVNDDVDGRAAIRVLRVCDCDQLCSSNDFEALYELELQCSCDSRLGLSKINSVTLLESFADLNETVILILDNDAVCGLSLSSINENMHTTYGLCANNAQTSFQLPWEEYSQQCVNFYVSNYYCS